MVYISDKKNFDFCCIFIEKDFYDYDSRIFRKSLLQLLVLIGHIQ